MSEYGQVAEIKVRSVLARKECRPWSELSCPFRVSVIARNNSILKKLVLEAKREYEKDAEHRVHIFMADSYVLTLKPNSTN